MAYVEKKKIILLLTLQRSTIPPFPAIPYNGDISIKISLHLINIDEIVQNSIYSKPGNRLYPGFPDDIFPVSNHGVYRYMMQISLLIFPFAREIKISFSRSESSFLSSKSAGALNASIECSNFWAILSPSSAISIVV